GQHLRQAAHAPAVVLRGALALAQADDAHLGDARLPLAAVVGVRLDARYGDHAVGTQGVAVPPDRLAPGVDADLPRVHVGLDRHAEVAFRDPIAFEHLALPLGTGAAVRAHRRDDERAGTEFLQAFNGRLDDLEDVGDAAAAAAD